MNRRIDQIENELRNMKKELNQATNAEEKSRKAMEDLASVLREVAAQASEAKDKMKSTQSELQAANEENEQMKLKLKSTNENLSNVMTELNKCKNEVERLRMEADETLAAWNEKECGLVECMKNVEEERMRVQSENLALLDEIRKLRDILKQAMAEATGAIEAATLVRAENSQLKEQLAEKDTTLNFMSIELESFRAAASSNLQESAAPNSNSQKEKMLQETTSGTYALTEAGNLDKEHKKLEKSFSFDMRCTGRNKRLEDLVDQNATKAVRGGSSLSLTKAERQDTASSLKRNMSCRFPDQPRISNERHWMDQGQDSLRKKALFKRFGEVLGARSSKSNLQ